MSESTESKQTEKKRVIRAVFFPRTMGIFVLLIIILAFIAGTARGELVLTLVGAVFLAVWAYCLVMTLLVALIQCRRAGRVSIRISPGEITAGEQAEALYSEAKDVPRRERAGMIRLPGILIRCRALLRTKDGRWIRHDFDPALAAREIFTVSKRGAYFSDYDELAVFDGLGFFRFAYLLPQAGYAAQEGGARLLAGPRAAKEPVPVKARSGETNQTPENTFQRTDNLIDHRPYVPGDDPRRINWKLYGHEGELFVREAEREPPPHSNILILIDTQFDSLLYSPGAARRGVDLLCENALAVALASPEGIEARGTVFGMDILIGHTGGTGLAGGTPAELTAALALPAALPLLDAAAELPAAPEDRGILILALPRASAETSALDRFLRNYAGRDAGRNKAQIVDLIFLYDGDESDSDHANTGLAAAAETCAALYNHRLGVRARALGVSST